MKRLIEFELEEGGAILVEVEMPEEPGMVPAAGIAQGVPEKAQHTFEAALDKINPVASAIIKKLRALHDPADEVEVEFGLKMSADAGAIIAAAGIEANYKVTLTWKREKSAPKS